MEPYIFCLVRSANDVNFMTVKEPCVWERKLGLDFLESAIRSCELGLEEIKHFAKDCVRRRGVPREPDCKAIFRYQDGPCRVSVSAYKSYPRTDDVVHYVLLLDTGDDGAKPAVILMDRPQIQEFLVKAKEVLNSPDSRMEEERGVIAKK